MGPVLAAASWGVIAGMRSMLPLAALGRVRSRSRALQLATIAGAASEFIYDKLPIAESRVEPLPLFARLSSGAFAGGVAAKVLAGSPVLGAASGALAALLSATAFHRARATDAALARPTVAGVAEDLLAGWLTGLAVRRLRPAPGGA